MRVNISEGFDMYGQRQGKFSPPSPEHKKALFSLGENRAWFG
jgi:hypothetical protein